MSRARTMTYPDGEQVATTYDVQGPMTLGTYVLSASYNAASQLTTLNLGNGLTTGYTYHAQNLRLTQLTTGGLQNLSYQYDNVGNVTRITDTVRSEISNFAYDDLDRLTSVTGAYTQGWVYNAIGNITQRTGVNAATFTYGDANHKHAVTQVGATAYTYDANGNMTARATDAFTYNAENRLTQATVGGVATQYVYNGDGARVKKTVNGITTFYVGNYYEVTNGAVTKYYYFGSQRVALRTSLGVTYLHGDHLGSTSATSGVNSSAQVYYPYGGVRATTGTMPTDFTYTGQRIDASANLMYYGARYYDAAIGRFTQPDTIVPDAQINRLSSLTVNFSNPTFLEELGREYRGTPSGLKVVQWFQESTNRPALQPSATIDPQNLNRYAYVRNNPLRYTDPSGYWTFGIGLGFTGGFFGGGISVSILLVFDDDGNVAIATSFGGGGVAGATASIGPTLQVTNADTVDDLSGPVVQTGGSISVGVGSVGAEWVHSTTSKGPVDGFNVNAGIGPSLPPFEFHIIVENTWIAHPGSPDLEDYLQWSEPVLWP